jgi:hypothetical protein
MNETEMMQLLKLFDALYVCDYCQARFCHYDESCTNPLHQLQDALYRLEDTNK